MNMRLEKDSMGELEVPSNALYGANTRRAVSYTHLTLPTNREV